MNVLRKSVFVLLVFSIGFTEFSVIHMAQPWGDNYAYQSLRGYLALAGCLGFAISPYVGFIFWQKLFLRSVKAMVACFIGAIVISAFGIYASLNAAFLHLDPWGGLVFIFLPIYQWIASAIVLGICFSIESFGRSNA